MRPIVSVRGVRTPPGALGKWWLGTYGLAVVDGKRTGDSLTGTLRSPSFRIRGDTMIYLVGGGRNPRNLRVSLLVEGVEVAWATGQNDDTLRPAAWDVAAWRDQSASIEIVDNATSRWGHLDVDGFWWFRP